MKNLSIYKSGIFGKICNFSMRKKFAVLLWKKQFVEERFQIFQRMLERSKD